MKIIFQFFIIGDNTKNETIREKIMLMHNEVKTNEFLRITKRVTNELLLLGYNFKLKGTQYLLESIVHIYTKNDMNLLENLEKNVYKHIATQNSKKTLNIKTSIIKATNYVYNYQDENKLYEYFSIEIKITPKLVISTILLIGRIP